MAVAVSQDGTHEEMRRRALRRRWLFIGGLAFATSAWGPRAAMMLADGWCASSQVLADEDNVGSTRERIVALERLVAYTDTTEGKDLEAKRQFGVGPRDESWITVEAEEPRAQQSPPQGIGDRVQGWLTDVGSSTVGRVRGAWDVVRYWVGLDDVSDCVPTEAAPEPEAKDEATGDDEGAQQ